MPITSIDTDCMPFSGIDLGVSVSLIDIKESIVFLSFIRYQNLQCENSENSKYYLLTRLPYLL